MLTFRRLEDDLRLERVNSSVIFPIPTPIQHPSGLLQYPIFGIRHSGSHLTEYNGQMGKWAVDVEMHNVGIYEDRYQ